MTTALPFWGHQLWRGTGVCAFYIGRTCRRLEAEEKFSHVIEA